MVMVARYLAIRSVSSNRHSRRGTLRERGYHMTEQDVENAEDLATAKVIRLRRILGTAQSKLNTIANEMEFVAKQLRGERNAALDTHDWLKSENITKAVADVELAESELAQANDALTALGVAAPPEIPRD